MTWYKSLRLAAQLLSAFIVVALIAAAVGIIGSVNINKISVADTFLYEKCTTPLGQLAIMERDFQLVRLYVQKTLTAKDTAEAQSLTQQADAAGKELEDQLAGFSKTLSSAEDETLYKQIIEEWGAYNKKRPVIMEMKVSGKTNEQIMAYVNAELVPLAKALAATLDKSVESNLKQAKDTATSNAQTTRSSMFIMNTAMVLGMLLAIGLGLFVTKIIKNQVGGEPREAAEVAQRVAGGDLSVEVHTAHGDTTSMMAAIREMVAKLSEIIGQVRDNSGTLVGAAEQLSATAQSLSQGASEQAASV
ncbi:MAG TPA: methyl-accepting chemotaxis protein, partial [Holophaga sp.]|nr:methyl-accepting chemotaxis protein [Holophaga sp.]